MLDSLVVHLVDQLANVLCDLRELLLDDLGHLRSWYFKNGEKTEEDASDLKLELEVRHELDPIAEDKDCLLLALHYSEGRRITIVQCQGE